jgi:hypothetical protein
MQREASEGIGERSGSHLGTLWEASGGFWKTHQDYAKPARLTERHLGSFWGALSCICKQLQELGEEAFRRQLEAVGVGRLRQTFLCGAEATLGIALDTCTRTDIHT